MTENFLGENIQEKILYLAITDTEFVKSIRNIVNKKFLNSSAARFVLQICYDYFDKFNSCPNQHFQDECVRLIETIKPELKNEYVTYILRIKNLQPIPHNSYILERISDFIRQRIHEHSVIKYAENVVHGDYQKALVTATDANQSGIQAVDTGLDYFSCSDLATRNLDTQYVMKTGIKSLDKVVYGLERGHLVAVMGGYKAAKSWFCIHLARQALIQGLNVLFVTHEMSENELSIRFDQSFGALLSSPTPEVIEWDMLQKDEKTFKK